MSLRRNPVKALLTQCRVNLGGQDLPSGKNCSVRSESARLVLRQVTSIPPLVVVEDLDKADENFRRSLSHRFQLPC